MPPLTRRAALAAVLAACAAHAHRALGRPFRLAYLSGTSRESASSIELYDVLREGLRAFGWVEGRDVVWEPRWAGGERDRLAASARELAAWNPDVFVANSTPVVAAVKAAAGAAAPIVMVVVSDPVGAGFVQSLARPGTNITGVTDFGLDTAGKLVELVQALLPSMRVLGVLTSGNPVHPLQFAAIRNTSEKLGMRAVNIEVLTTAEIERGFAQLTAEGGKALVILGGPPQSSMRERMAELGLQHGIATIGLIRQYAEAGSLAGYGPNLRNNYRDAAGYVDKLLRGARAAELAVQQPRELELVLNLRTARALKLRVPQSVLIQAREVIE